MRILPLVAGLFLALPTMSLAATLNETDIVGGFSSDFATPTEIGNGTETVNGTLDGNDFDFLHFTGLNAGAQSLFFLLNLADPSGLTGFQNAGGQIRFNETAPSFAFQGDQLDFNLVYDPFDLPGAVVVQTLTYDLDSSFAGGDFYVSILTTFSSQSLSFGAIVPGNAVAPSPVPVPAAGLLLLGALGGIAAMRRRKSLPLLA